MFWCVLPQMSALRSFQEHHQLSSSLILVHVQNIKSEVVGVIDQTYMWKNKLKNIVHYIIFIVSTCIVCSTCSTVT